MNKCDLDSLLKKARTPEPPQKFWAELPQQVARELNRAQTENFRPGRNSFPRLTWGFATAVCVLAAFVIGHWRGRMEVKASSDVLADATVVRETLAMFPNQVRAIVEDEHGLNLVLSQSDDVPTSPPLYVHISDGKHSSSLVTFSGQEIQIAGQKITVLSDAQGGIILMGNDFAWSSHEPSYAKSDLKIEAENLGPVAM
jgi:hypothetical protein